MRNFKNFSTPCHTITCFPPVAMIPAWFLEGQSILFNFAQAPLKPYNWDVNFRFFENFAGIGKNLTINTVTIVNLEPNYGLILEIKIIPNYLQGHMVFICAI